MKALIIGSDPTGHEVAVQTAFEAGGGVDSDIYESALNQTLIDYATTNDYDAIIYSYENVANYLTLANSNPDVMIFMPTNESFAEQTQQLVVTDSEQDLQDGEYEFLDSTQASDSNSNGYICGQLFYIAEQRGCSLQEARICANATKDTDGIIDVASAIAYTGIIQLTVGSITAERTSGFSVTITLERVVDATSYKIYRNNVLISTQTGLTYTDTLPDFGKYNYKYIAYNGDLTSNYSTKDRVDYPRIDNIIVR